MPANDETVCVMCGHDFGEPGHLNNLGRCPKCQAKFDRPGGILGPDEPKEDE